LVAGWGPLLTTIIEKLSSSPASYVLSGFVVKTEMFDWANEKETANNKKNKSSSLFI
jgi:hypothetical protein